MTYQLLNYFEDGEFGDWFKSLVDDYVYFTPLDIKEINDAQYKNTLLSADALVIESNTINVNSLKFLLESVGVQRPIFLIDNKSNTRKNTGPKNKTINKIHNNIYRIKSEEPDEIVHEFNKYVNISQLNRKVNITLAEQVKSINRPDLSPPNNGHFVDQLLEHVPIGILILSKSDKIRFANKYAAEIFETGPLTLIGKHIGEMLKTFGGDFSFYENSTPYEAPADFELKLPSGKTHYISMRMAIFYEDSGTERHMVILEDNTSKILAKIIAENASAAKVDFLRSMSHELRTTLNAIIGFSELLLLPSVAKSNDQVKEYLDYILKSGKHLLNIINDILDLSKIEAGGIEPSLEQVEINSLMKSCEAFVYPQCKEKDISLEFIEPENYFTLYTDERLLRQIIINLLTNAVKFTLNGGYIKIQIEMNNNDDVIISITDNGIGIAHSDIPKILEPFAQINSDPFYSQEGTGLGLPLSNKLTKLLGGELKIESEVYEGTKVNLIFPKAKSDKSD
ncbi:MAG: PAS domain-containing sensor histidine kinase [Kordiimonadaceae bacterium]|nr:PAS domain-containing sensor histidine kinase [Kordiimonadaceae bacterium]